MAHHRRAELLSDRAALRTRMAAWRESHQIVALVPTMGALHEGHLSLVRLIAARADRLLVSIFVNPAQFTPSEDFSAYPRTLEADREKLGATVDAIYCPPVADIYPADFVTSISLEGPATTGLEDRFRPTHFKGVATVVAKLFLQTTPHLAVFGEKDFQQLCVIRQMVRDLELPVNVVAAPTIREADGLALSSRNVYLSEGERAAAPLIYHTLTQCAERLRQGDEANLVLAEGVAILEKSGFSVDYLEWRQADTLQPATTIEQPSRLLVAARIGVTRLIDNIAV
ncbi:MAG: pantoate--beta-alanine ligase [Hyphomicrobiales bacterium]|nr:pantoate--beta-alanine ligase [Hyphomicrobiales bacterium]OQW81994.1 MAG: pantoate--beta-alanine ligase [Proteobacteria bacterium ST_bin15]